MNTYQALFPLALSLAIAAPLGAQTCTGPRTSLPGAAKDIVPGINYGKNPFVMNLTKTFSVKVSGVYEITGGVSARPVQPARQNASIARRRWHRSFSSHPQAITINSWPTLGSDPSRTGISLTIPGTGEVTSFSIFIASSFKTT